MNNDLDKDFEDHAWAKMRKLLDEEQPVAGVSFPPIVPSGNAGFDDKKQKRKGRVVLFFLFFWVLVGGGLMSKWAVQMGGNNPQIVDAKEIESTEIKQSETKPIQPLILLNQEKNAANIVQNRNENSTKTETPIESIYVLQNPIFQPKNPTEKRTEFTVLKDNNLGELNKKAVAHEENLLNKNEVRIADNLIENSIIPIEKPIDTNANETPNVELQAVQSTPQYFDQKERFSKENDSKQLISEAKPNIERLDLKPITALKMEENRVELLLPKLEMPPIVSVENIVQKSPSRTRWGITLGANTEGGKQPNQGFQLGVVFQRDLTPKLSLQTGLNFRHTNVENSNIPYTQLPDSIYQRIAFDVNQVAPSAIGSYPTKDAVLSSVNYLEMPVSVSYKFNENLSVIVGAKASFLLQASLINPSSTAVASSVGSNFSVGSRNFTSQNYSTNDLSVNRWDVAIFGGVEYTFNQHFAVNMKYDFGLKNTINANDLRQLYNRYLNLNLTYFLTRTKAN